MGKRDPRSDRLKAEIKNNKLVISIGLPCLKWAFEHSDMAQPYDEDRGEYRQVLEVSDEKQFAKDVIAALLHEDELGTTDLHRLLDDAFEMAAENGSLGISECDKKAKDA